MFREHYDDQLATHGQEFAAMHCLMCGDIVDPVILANRRNRVEPRVERARLAVVTAV